MGIHPVIFIVNSGEKHKAFINLCINAGIHFASAGRHNHQLYFKLAETYQVLDDLAEQCKGKYYLISQLHENYRMRTNQQTYYHSV